MLPICLEKWEAYIFLLLFVFIIKDLLKNKNDNLNFINKVVYSYSQFKIYPNGYRMDCYIFLTNKNSKNYEKNDPKDFNDMALVTIILIMLH
jgi:hypothetical protein